MSTRLRALTPPRRMHFPVIVFTRFGTGIHTLGGVGGFAFVLYQSVHVYPIIRGMVMGGACTFVTGSLQFLDCFLMKLTIMMKRSLNFEDPTFPEHSSSRYVSPDRNSHSDAEQTFLKEIRSRSLPHLQFSVGSVRCSFEVISFVEPDVL